MSHFLLTSTPIYGHVAPMLTVSRSLVFRGHQVTMLTFHRKYRGAVESHAMTFQPLPDEVDYDDANLDAWLPGRKQFRGLAAGRSRTNIIGIFIRPLQSQYYAFTDALASRSVHRRRRQRDRVLGSTASALLSVPAAAGHRLRASPRPPPVGGQHRLRPIRGGLGDANRRRRPRHINERRDRLLCNAVLERGLTGPPFRMRSTTHWPGWACPPPPTVTSTRSLSLTSPFILRCRPSNTRGASYPRPCASSDHSGRDRSGKRPACCPGGPTSNARGRSYT